MDPFQRQLKGNVSIQEPSGNRELTEQTKTAAKTLHKWKSAQTDGGLW